ncbi:hypothetical protein ONE63_002872 [Megalurothrips usitatus]|uniref:Uncharacterized protein n=1 Tax=Megalurothrips usitatus TaxID=439358 RepID=A0AAV7X8M4_9NEOP|nr:hypothetical protein ONE63_002872 [Megalurothrips usitatus]
MGKARYYHMAHSFMRGISPQPSREPQPQGREKPSLSQPNSRRTESHYGQPVPNVILTPGRGMLLEGPSQAIDAPLHSSTPTKPDSATGSPLLVGNTFSPIERDVPQMKYSSGRQAFFNEEANQTVDEDSKRQTPGTPDNVKPSLVLTPKSTMTAEELYAKIHKSKKQMKIKCDPETVISPQPSVGSQSPVNSERSVSPASINDPKMAARSRHSWSPNSSKYLDIASNFDPRSSTPSPNPRVPKEHGLTQTTSTQDFKRLLLQHGSGTTGKSKLSAVERLKQAKQMATNVITNNAPKFRFGLSNSNIATRGLNSQISSSSNQLQSVSSKLAPTKSSLLKPGPKNWRFADQKNDVRSTPIMEDQREDEHDLGSFEIQTLLSSPMPARNLGRPILNKQPSQEKSEISTGTQVGAMPNSGRVVPDSRVLQTLRSYQPSQESISSQNHTGYPKQLRFGPTQTLPAPNQGSDSCKSVNDCPAALETAL